MITALTIVRRSVSLAWTIVFLTLGAWALSYTAPLWFSKATALFSHFIGGWTESACERSKEASS